MKGAAGIVTTFAVATILVSSLFGSVANQVFPGTPFNVPAAEAEIQEDDSGLVATDVSAPASSALDDDGMTPALSNPSYSNIQSTPNNPTAGTEVTMSVDWSDADGLDTSTDYVNVTTTSYTWSITTLTDDLSGTSDTSSFKYTIPSNTNHIEWYVTADDVNGNTGTTPVQTIMVSQGAPVPRQQGADEILETGTTAPIVVEPEEAETNHIDTETAAEPATPVAALPERTIEEETSQAPAGGGFWNWLKNLFRGPKQGGSFEKKECKDTDGDGWGWDNCGLCPEAKKAGSNQCDCNEQFSDVNPGMGEICGNQLDDDCDSNVDENKCCTDNDGDGFGQAGWANLCPGVVVDCDDNDASINPGVKEICDGMDNDCSGSDGGCTQDFRCEQVGGEYTCVPDCTNSQNFGVSFTLRDDECAKIGNAFYMEVVDLRQAGSYYWADIELQAKIDPDAQDETEDNMLKGKVAITPSNSSYFGSYKIMSGSISSKKAVFTVREGTSIGITTDDDYVSIGSTGMEIELASIGTTASGTLQAKLNIRETGSADSSSKTVLSGSYTTYQVGSTTYRISAVSLIQGSARAGIADSARLFVIKA